ncbi:MAG: apolipoprotein N-acyltransferase [Gammaproteobacteria bacterium]
MRISEFLNHHQRTRKFLLYLALFTGGLLLVFSFAPYNQFWLAYPLIAGWFLLMVNQSSGQVFKRSFWFSLGWFTHGIYWIYYSLHVHGGAPVAMAVFMVFCLAAVLALFPALCLWLARKYIALNEQWQLLLLLPLSVFMAEWLRGVVLTGLPWVQLGYSQIDTVLAGYTPLVGGLGVTGLTLFIAGIMAYMLWYKRYLRPMAVIGVISLLGAGLQHIEWTEAEGKSIRVSLIQGNIAQKDKWQAYFFTPTLDMYRDLTRQNWDSDLIVWPETAIPGYRHRVQPFLESLSKEAEQNHSEVLLGLFIRDPEKRRYYNSVISTSDGEYRKRHLVPLGEYYPFRSLISFFSRWIRIPMSDVDFGPEQQPLLAAAGQKLGISICFEDVFDRDVRQTLPEASMLVNVSNDAWFEDSTEPWQHHQKARMRALESGRYMLRSTNTGVSSIITPQGDVLAISPQFTRHVITADVQGMTGRTPYVFWGNYLLVSLALSVLAALGWKTRPKQ